MGKGPVRGSFHILNYVVCVQSCDGSRGGYIIESGNFPILYFVLLAIKVCLRFIPSKSLTCGYSICVPDTFVVGYHTVPTHY